MPGRAVCPALGTGGWWTPWYAARPPGAGAGANEVGHRSGCRVCSAQEPSWLVGLLRLGVGHASTVRPDPSTLGVVGERGSRHESCLQFVPGSARQALDLLQVGRGDALGWPLEQRPRRIVRQDDSADVGELLAQVIVLERSLVVTRPPVASRRPRRPLWSWPSPAARRPTGFFGCSEFDRAERRPGYVDLIEPYYRR